MKCAGKAASIESNRIESSKARRLIAVYILPAVPSSREWSQSSRKTAPCPKLLAPSSLVARRWKQTRSLVLLDDLRILVGLAEE